MDEAKKRIAELTAELNEHCHSYYVLNAAVITDAEYDDKFSELRKLEAAHPTLALANSPTKRIGGVATSFAKVRHGRKMLSLDNTYTGAEVIKWFGEEKDVSLHPKIDGASLKLVYKDGELVQAVTRGDGTSGEDVTANARTIMTVPLALIEPVNIEVVGEVYMRYSVFNELNRQLEDDGEDLFANPRNAAAGSLKLKNAAEVASRNLSFVAYGTATDVAGVTTQRALDEYLECLGFQSVYMLPTVSSTENLARVVAFTTVVELDALIGGCDMLRGLYDLATDGLVFKVNSLEKQRELGDGTRSPKWAVAYKYPPERKVTKLVNVVVQVGKTGKVTPVAELAPVHLSGTTVTKASLCNANEIERLGVDIGDDVLVEKSAEIIPKVMGCAKPSPGKSVWKMPAACPCCGTPLVKPEGFVDYYCPNTVLCDDQIFARLKHALGKQCLDVDGCGDVMVRVLMDNGVRRLSDVFAFNKIRDVVKASASVRFYRGRAAAKKVPLWRKLHALGIEGMGKSRCQDVASRFGTIRNIVDKLFELKPMLGEVVYKNFVEQLDADEIERLEGHGVVFEDDRASIGLLSGKSFVITGTLTTGTRDQVSRRIEEAGGVCKSTVSRTTSFLVIGEAGGAQKVTRAATYNVPTISEKELYEMMGVPMPVAQETGDPNQEF